jgi:hypothetical protein
MSMPSLDNAGLTPSAALWSPFEEPRFVDVVSAVIEASPQTLSKRLCSDGISPSLWKQMGLPEATAPPDNQPPYTENELLELFAAVSGEAKASLSPEWGGIVDARPLDRSTGDVDMQTFDTFYSTGSPLPLRIRSRERHASTNESPNQASLLRTGNSSPLSTFSSRLSSLDKFAPNVESRQPSSHSLIMNRWSATDITPFSGLEISSLQVEASSPSSELSPLEAQSFTAGQSTDSDTHRIEDEAIKGSAESEQFQIAATPMGKTFGQPAYSNIAEINILPTVMVPTRKHSSDESQETNESMSSDIQSSLNSCSAANRQSSAPSADRSMMTVEQQHPAAVWKKPSSKRDEHTPGHGDEADLLMI